MPFYNYRCAQCGVFDQMRRVAMRDEAALCPQCGAPSVREQNGLPVLLARSEDTSMTDEGEGAYLGRHASSCFCCV
ncbi:FmdB family zinc ribbon protein [Paraburkholderia fynbosensis]|uniref:FmdB family zinc ribbon protein n=1 Tax=Paraburkholderia fynbosensis TaxID=1200993 RepID=UPI001582D7F2|nr:FmdB family zinc ribbon protein [Paraburkholderia fynbosensis]